MNKTTAIVFFGIILSGLAISLFTLTKCSSRVETVTDGSSSEVEAAPESPDTPTPAPKPEPVPEPVPKVEEAPVPTPVVDKPVPAKPDRADGTYSSPALLMSAMRDSAINRDVDAFLEMAGPGAVSDNTKKELTELFADTDYTIRPEKPVTELAQTPGGKSRWSLHFSPDPKGTTEKANLPDRTVNTDLLKKGGDAGVVVEKVIVPTPLMAAAPPSIIANEKIGSGSVDGALASTMPEMSVEDRSDALTVAHAFSQAVVSKNFEAARQLTDPERVTDERVAALMMALEEGNFSLREEKPLVVTLTQDELKWVLTRIDSSGSFGKSEFAIEMSPNIESESKTWQIHALTFSKLISTLASSSGAGGVAYTPLVENPEGGDSIVLYFEFDDGEVTTRTSRQLKIVSDILKQDPKRKIYINGHADALGSDDYNSALSDERAAAVSRALIANGVSPEQVVTRAFGESKPVRPNYNDDGTDNPGNRSQNRRAEVYLDF